MTNGLVQHITVEESTSIHRLGEALVKDSLSHITRMVMYAYTFCRKKCECKSCTFWQKVYSTFEIYEIKVSIHEILCFRMATVEDMNL